MGNLSINSFLKYGYFMDYPKDTYQILPSDKRSQYSHLSKEEHIEMGSKLFKKAIENNFITNKNHVVPISGGLDSRAILGGLLEFTEAKNIKTYTFGTKGTLDYEIGCEVARVMGTNHQAYSLQDYVYNQEEMLEASKRVRNQTFLFHHPPIKQVDEFVNGDIVWSGYLGDLMAGGRQPKTPSEDLINAKLDYLKNSKFVNSIELTNISDTEFLPLINFKSFEKEFVSYEEQIIMYERAAKLVSPHVLLQGYQYKNPFINNEWMDFYLSVDKSYRINENLFINTLLKMYPKLFSIRTKTSAGLPLTANQNIVNTKKIINKIQRKLSQSYSRIANPNINYLDFDKAIREKKDINTLFEINLKDLQSRQIIDWIKIDEIWKKHINNENNYGDALLNLVSLELHLKSKKS